MKSFVNLFCWLLRWSGSAYIARSIFAKGRVTIINYHNPSSEAFIRHLKYFSKTYSIIGLETLSAALKDRDFSTLPPNSMVITIDDGHADNYSLRNAIQRFGVPVTIYLVSGIVGTGRHYWFKHAGLDSRMLKYLKSLSNDERITALATYGHTVEQEYTDRHALTHEEIRAMQDVGVTFASHTVTHPILTRCSPETIKYELLESRKTLENITRTPILHFAYPNGDWNQEVKQVVADAGYYTARTIRPGFVSLDCDPLALPNFGISDDAGLNKAILQASGLWYSIKKLFRKDIQVPEYEN